MKTHNHNLNIHYTAPNDIWDKLHDLYTKMPHWNDSVKDIPTWYHQENDGKLIEVSVEPSGLQFYAEMPQEEWDIWFSLFKSRASEIMGYEVGEPEDGFEFRYYD